MTLHPQKSPDSYKFYSYFRSSASYRVRIALNLKHVNHETIFVNLKKGGQQEEDYKKVNSQALVPALTWEDHCLTQSLAIIDYLEGLFPVPPLYPEDPFERAQALEIAHIVSMDIHPLNNLRVLKYLTNELKVGENDRLQWYQHWVKEGLAAIEEKLKLFASEGLYCIGHQVTIADICLIPQVYNALRFECDVRPYKRIMHIYETCMQTLEFSNACPESQEDANFK